MTVLADPRVVAIRIHPVKDEPGVELANAVVEIDGLAGDRRKKAAVHLVGLPEAATTRANLVIDIPTDRLAELVGRTVAVGSATLAITRTAGNCAGVYADVRTPGMITIEDRIDLVD